MGIGAAIFLMALGAILAFAVDVHISGIDLNVVGWILLILGAFGLALSLVLWSRRKDYRDDYRDDPRL